MGNRVPLMLKDVLVYKETKEMLSGHPVIAQIHMVDRC